VVKPRRSDEQDRITLGRITEAPLFVSGIENASQATYKPAAE